MVLRSRVNACRRTICTTGERVLTSRRSVGRSVEPEGWTSRAVIGHMPSARRVTSGRSGRTDSAGNLCAPRSALSPPRGLVCAVITRRRAEPASKNVSRPRSSSHSRDRAVIHPKRTVERGRYMPRRRYWRSFTVHGTGPDLPKRGPQANEEQTPLLLRTRLE